VRYLNPDSFPIWESAVVFAAALALLSFRCRELFEPGKRIVGTAGMTAGMLVLALAVTARHETVGHGAALLALFAVTFSLASIGKMEELKIAAEDQRRGEAPGLAPIIVVLRIAVLAPLVYLAYWLMLKA
jgi:hypothetical protein